MTVPELPDFANYVAGVRRWRVAPTLWARLGGVLWAEAMREPWPNAEEYKATCEEGHKEPEEDCRCGIHACFDYEQLAEVWPVHRNGFTHVSGVIAIRGVFWEHEKGLRAQFANVVALFDDVEDDALHIPKGEIVEAYGGIPIIKPTEYLGFCRENSLVVLGD